MKNLFWFQIKHDSLSSQPELQQQTINISDHLFRIIRKEFPDSKAGKDYSCGRTKTPAIVNCIGDLVFEELKSALQTQPFSVMLDASNHKGIEKMFPITVSIFNENFDRIVTQFFDMNLLQGRDGSTAEVMFNSVDNQFEEHEIRWDYCAALGVDTNVNIGDYDSIKSMVREKYENMIVVGCPCHILHNATEKDGVEFAKNSEFDVSGHCTDLCYWFANSSKLKSVLKEYNEFCGEEYAEVIKNILTRWLCLEKCSNREIQKFDGFKSYFLSEDFPDARYKRLKEHFTDPMAKVYTTFYQPTLPVFTTFNMLVQSEAPLIHYFPSEQQRFMSRLANKFIKTCVIQNLKTRGESFSSLDIFVSNQLDDDDLSVGILTKSLINHILVDGSICESQVDKFYDSVRAFYERAYEYYI